jgi:F0F1-type ATP synthase assembly protein I
MSASRDEGRPAATASVSRAMTQGVQRDQDRSAPDNAAMDQGMRVLSYLISGVLLYGALGWVGDHFLHTRFLLPIGIVLGAAFGIYTTIRRLAVTDLAAPPAGTPATTKEGDR